MDDATSPDSSPLDAVSVAAPGLAAELPPGAELEPIVPSPIDDGGVDTAFSVNLAPEVQAFGAPKPLASVCQWCNAGLPDPDVAICPHCGGRLKPIDEALEVPGLTTITPEARAALERAAVQRLRDAARRGRTNEPPFQVGGSSPAEPPPAPVPELDDAEVQAAIAPPEDAVRRLMLEMELEALRSARARDQLPLEIGEPEPGGSEPEPEPAEPVAPDEPAAPSTSERPAP